MNPDLVAPFVAAVVFGSGMAGLYLQAWRPRNEETDETHDLINRITGLVATLAALVLGLLIASASNFYNTQKSGLETVSARILQLDSVLRRYGSETQPTRDILREMVTQSYESVWHSGGGNLVMPTIEQTGANMNAIIASLNSLRETEPAARQDMLTRAEEITASISDQRLQMSLQVTNSLTWPFMMILVTWACLLFFGFGMLAQVNLTAISALAVGALSVGGAIFLIVELSTPYAGMLRLSPEPVLRTIEALSK